jgi:hypothetical protein
MHVNPSLPVSWSNRLGCTLTPIATGVWAAERPFTWNKIDVGGRSVVCRVGDGKLLVHSPVQWTKSLGNCLESLGGGVGYVVSPNYEHLKYTQEWANMYPEAIKIACPGLPQHLPDVKWSEIDADDAKFSKEFRDTIEYVHFDCEVNPFTNKPFFNEVVWFHVRSKTVFMADVYWNYPRHAHPKYNADEEGTGRIHICPKMPVDNAPESGLLPEVPVPVGTALWKLGMDRVYLPFYKRFMVGKSGERRRKYEDAVATVLSWQPEVIVPCHGDVVRGRELCSKVLTEHFF